MQLNGQIIPLGDTHARTWYPHNPFKYNTDTVTGHRQCIYIDGDWKEDNDEHRPVVKVVRSIFRAFNEQQFRYISSRSNMAYRGEDDYVKLDNPGMLLELLLGGSMERGMRMWPEEEVGRVAAPCRGN